MDIAQLTSFSICVPKKSAYRRFKLISSVSVGFRDASCRFYAGSVDLVVFFAGIGWSRQFDSAGFVWKDSPVWLICGLVELILPVLVGLAEFSWSGQF